MKELGSKILNTFILSLSKLVFLFIWMEKKKKRQDTLKKNICRNRYMENRFLLVFYLYQNLFFFLFGWKKKRQDT